MPLPLPFPLLLSSSVLTPFLALLAVVLNPACAIPLLSSSLLAPFLLQVLLDQPYIRDPDMTVDALVKSYIAKLGENIKVARFVRFEVGGGGEKPEEESE